MGRRARREQTVLDNTRVLWGNLVCIPSGGDLVKEPCEMDYCSDRVLIFFFFFRTTSTFKGLVVEASGVLGLFLRF